MCTVKTTSRAYAIAFNYEFVEDFAVSDPVNYTDSGFDSRLDNLAIKYFNVLVHQ